MALPALSLPHILSSHQKPANWETTLQRVEEDHTRWANTQAQTDTSTFPTLHIDDLSGIPFTQNVVGVEQYQLRARVRAKTGDLFAATCPAMLDYEWYNRTVLQLGRPTFIHADGGTRPAAVASACQSGFAAQQLAAIARHHGGLVIHPYMGIAPIWELAEELRQRSGTPITVLSSTPAATTLANNKVYFTKLVQEKLHPDCVAPSRFASQPEDIVMALYDLSRAHDTVALKMPECASSTGIECFSRHQIEHSSYEELHRAVTVFLTEKQWEPQTPIQIVAWLDASHSPSSQVWIPANPAKPAIVQGVYEQLFTGSDNMFLGSIPSPLSNRLKQAISTLSIQAATQLRKLGMIGRCSFDFIVHNGRPVLIECNGRWGGTSTPMYLVDRIFPKQRPAYIAKDVQSDTWVGCTFKELAHRFGKTLYNPATGQGTYILYNVGCLETSGKFDVIAIGSTPAEAKKAMMNDLPTIIKNP